jgi:hypothetical protein
MGSTFLSLTNRVIRKINEVELTETSFASAKGMQAVVKDSVVDAINEINQQRWEWPYHCMIGTQVLTIGTTFYLWPSDFKSVDWQSFRISRDDALDIASKTLPEIDIDEFYKYFRDLDAAASPTGRQPPVYAFKNPAGGFGVTPSPDKAYTVEYTYFKNANVLTNFSDTTDIPTNFDNVITWGALYHMNLFRENPQGEQIAESKFKEGIGNMYDQLVKTAPPYVYDGRTNLGGGPFYGETGAYHL